MTTRTKILFALVVLVFVAGIIYLTYYLTRRQITKADFPLLPSSTTSGTSASTSEPTPAPSSGEANQSNSVTLQLSAGFNLVSFGHRLSPADCKNVFANLSTKEVFALLQGKWVSCSESQWSVTPGEGYFVKSKSGENLKVLAQATPVATNERFPMKLRAGWNAIGNPYPKSFKLELAKVEVQFDDKTETAKEAIDGKHVSPFHFFDPISGSFKEIKEGDTIELNQGFVIQASGAATLTFPGPGQ